MYSILGLNLFWVILFMTGVWLISLWKKDASIVDVSWGLGFVLVAWLTFARADGYLGRRILVMALTTLWGLRLSLHIFLRNKGKGEDPRYAAMRERHGEKFWWMSFFTVFMLQASLLWIISLVVQIAQISPGPVGLIWLDIVGLLIWAFGFLFESIGDWQLKEFQKNPENSGKVFDGGLWRYTRHPNYFGESLVWWGMFFIAAATPGGLWVIISPILITVLLLKVSGVVMLEELMTTTHPEYTDYVRNTSAFIPWFPGKRRQVL